ncbi:hypothetical protein PT2222_170135 [Paraburkholderia tropica]
MMDILALIPAHIPIDTLFGAGTMNPPVKACVALRISRPPLRYSTGIRSTVRRSCASTRAP